MGGQTTEGIGACAVRRERSLTLASAAVKAV